MIESSQACDRTPDLLHTQNLTKFEIRGNVNIINIYCICILGHAATGSCLSVMQLLSNESVVVTLVRSCVFNYEMSQVLLASFDFLTKA